MRLNEIFRNIKFEVELWISSVSTLRASAIPDAAGTELRRAGTNTGNHGGVV